MTPTNIYNNNDSNVVYFSQYKYSIDQLKNNIDNLNNISYNGLKNIILQLIKQIDLYFIEIEKIKNYSNNEFNLAYNSYMELKKNYTSLNKTSIRKINNLKFKIEELENKTQLNINTCCVCLSETSNYANINCGHLCVCKTCHYNLNNKCPICRTEGLFIKIICS